MTTLRANGPSQQSVGDYSQEPAAWRNSQSGTTLRANGLAQQSVGNYSQAKRTLRTSRSRRDLEDRKFEELRLDEATTSGKGNPEAKTDKTVHHKWDTGTHRHLKSAKGHPKSAQGPQSEPGGTLEGPNKQQKSNRKEGQDRDPVSLSMCECAGQLI